jgi:pilus assembly protein Flp/PilA
MRLVTRFLADQSGATSIEYGLIAAGISVAIIAAVNSVGTSLNASFTALSTAMK